MFEKKLFFFLILLSLIVFTFFPHLQTKFTSNDDTYAAIQATQGSRLTAAIKEATEQGRFQFVFGYLGSFVPYLLDNPAYYQGIRLGSILVNFLLYFILIKNLSKSRHLAMLATVLAFAFLQNNWQHNLVTSYPFLYHLGLSMFFLSIIYLLKAIENGAYRYNVISGTFFFTACMTYESFLPLIIIYPFILLILSPQVFTSIKVFWRRAIYSLFPHLVVVCLYLVTYIIFRSIFPGKNPGVQLGTLSFKPGLNVMVQFITSTLPGYFYIKDPNSMAATFDGLSDDFGGLVALFKYLRGDWLLKGIMIVLASCYLLQQSKNIFTKRAFLAAACLGVGMMILPVSLLGLTPKYQEWVRNGILAYVPCYFSYFGTILLISTILLGINQIIFHRKIVHYAFMILVSCMIFLSSLATDFYNYYITLDQQFSQAKWNAFDLFIQTTDFKQIPDGSIVYAPTLWRHKGNMANHPSYWSDYVRIKTRRNILLTNNHEELREIVKQRNSCQVYSLSIWQDDKDSSQFLIFSEIDKEHNSKLMPLSKKISVFFYGRHRKGYIFGTWSSPDQKPVVTIDGKQTNDLMSNVFGGFIDNTLKTAHLKKAVVQSTALLDLENISVSFFPVPIRLSSFRHNLGNGFYSQENDSEGHTWNWSNGNAFVEIVNCQTKPRQVLLEFGMGSLEPRRVDIFFKGVAKVSHEFLSSENQKVQIGMELEPGRNFLEINTNTPAMKPRHGDDKRDLAFKVIDLTVTEVSGGNYKKR
jgi:hypothetical protein